MQTLRITVRDVDLAGSVIDTAFAHGANIIQDITFGLTDAGPYNDQALAQAVSDGMHKAEVIADAAGLTLPAFPKSIVEDVNAYYDRGLLVNAESAMDAAGMGASVMGGTLKVTASVVLTYEIDD